MLTYAAPTENVSHRDGSTNWKEGDTQLAMDDIHG